MRLALGIAILLILFLLSQNLLRRRNIHRLNQQLSEILENFGTNELLRTSLPDAAMNRFSEQVNLLIQRYKLEQQRMQKNNDALRQEVTNLSHDLRTPLTSIKGFTELLQRDLSSAERQEYTELVLQKVISLNEMIEQFYDLAKIESADIQLHYQEISLPQLLAEAVMPFQQDFEKRGLTITLEETNLNQKLLVDPLYTKRIITNILQNCLRYSRSFVKISGTLTESGQFSLTFKNDTDFPVPDSQKIFQRSYSADTSRSQGQTGLGLYISRQLIELQGGKIAADYQQEIFRISLTFAKN
ncbi:sensor histidine kinase [Enterococcus sp. LJL120]